MAFTMGFTISLQIIDKRARKVILPYTPSVNNSTGEQVFPVIQPCNRTGKVLSFKHLQLM